MNKELKQLKSEMFGYSKFMECHDFEIMATKLEECSEKDLILIQSLRSERINREKYMLGLFKFLAEKDQFLHLPGGDVVSCKLLTYGPGNLELIVSFGGGKTALAEIDNDDNIVLTKIIRN